MTPGERKFLGWVLVTPMAIAIAIELARITTAPVLGVIAVFVTFIVGIQLLVFSK